jgi:hypothetical protein
MPDGGVCCHRCWNPVMINTFFTIFNMKQIKEVYNKEEIAKINTWDNNLDLYTPKYLIKTWDPKACPEHCKVVLESNQIPYNCRYEFYEPYYRIFIYLLQQGLTCDYMDGRDSELDGGFTTLLCDYGRRPFAAHTWYARTFQSDPKNRERILKIYNWAKENKVNI